MSRRPSVEERIANGTSGTCQDCGRVVRVVNPRGGNGSARITVRHRDGDRQCPGSRLYAVEWNSWPEHG